MCGQIKNIEEYMQDYLERLRLIREGSQDYLERAGKLREDMEAYICEHTPETFAKNKDEVNIKI